MATKRKSTKAKKTKKAGSKKIGSMGSKIMAKAKQIRKANPNLKWTTCVSRAAKQI
jgi:hypothetical protein